jgi:hypothetical protein
MNLGASLPRTLKQCKPLIGDTLRYMKSPTSKLNSVLLWSALLFCLDCAIRWFTLTLQTCLSVFCSMLGSKIFHSLFSLQNNGVQHLRQYSISNGTCSNSLNSYCCRKTWHTANSYPNFFHIAEHNLSAYPQEPVLLSWFVHRSEGDKENLSSAEYARFHATSPRNLK